MRFRPLARLADIVVDLRSGALAVPIIALTVREDTVAVEEGPVPEVEGVFLVEGGVARFQPVVIGIAGAEYFEVVEGLSGGETVVAGPYQTIRTLQDGDPVQRDETASPAAGAAGS